MKTEATTLPETCKHHWVIEMPNGPLSRGLCKRCGSERFFYNNPEDARAGLSEAERPAAA